MVHIIMGHHDLHSIEISLFADDLWQLSLKIVDSVAGTLGNRYTNWTTCAKPMILGYFGLGSPWLKYSHRGRIELLNYQA